MDVRAIASVGIRVVLCLAIESVVVLQVTLYLMFQGWTLLCGQQCDEAEAWIIYPIVGVLAATIPPVYVIVSLALGRTPLMKVLRVPGLWTAFRKQSPTGVR